MMQKETSIKIQALKNTVGVMLIGSLCITLVVSIIVGPLWYCQHNDIDPAYALISLVVLAGSIMIGCNVYGEQYNRVKRKFNNEN